MTSASRNTKIPPSTAVSLVSVKVNDKAEISSLVSKRRPRISRRIGNSSVPGTTTTLSAGRFNSTPSGRAATVIDTIPISASATSARVPPPPRLTALTFTKTGSCSPDTSVAKLFGKTILASKSSASV